MWVQDDVMFCKICNHRRRQL